MTAVRVYRTGLASSTATRVRAYRTGLASNPASATRVRVHRAGLTSQALVGVTVPTLSNLEPGVRVVFVVAVTGLAPGTQPTISNSLGVPFVVDSASGSVSYVPPATSAGVSITWTAVVGNATASASHGILRHGGRWMRGATGTLFPILVPTDEQLNPPPAAAAAGFGNDFGNNLGN